MPFFNAFPQKTKVWLFSWYGSEEILAQWISNLVSPPVVGILTAIAFIFYTVPNPLQVCSWLAWGLPLICLPPLAYVLWLIHRGELADIHMPDRRSRLKPLGLMVVWGGVCLFLLRYWGAPPALIPILLTTWVYMAALSAITLFWKISFHSTTISAAASVGIVASGLTGWSMVAMLLVPVVGWARVYLHRHTLGQVIAGCLTGTSIGLLLLIS
ncbi:MAG: hypothetical protein JW953_12835 [Anaerolineae bacterium]|nr:hypothetical protein [Anaerolineae bacterium]